MPITFESRIFGSQPSYTAAELHSVTVDIRSRRLIITVVYGDIVNGQFVNNATIPASVHAFDGPQFISVMNDAVGVMNFKQIFTKVIWKHLKANAKESGTEV